MHKLMIERLQQHPQGKLPFDDVMRLALYEPGWGYYARDNPVFGVWSGDGSDFITAPEMSSLFGQALAVQIRQILRLTVPAVTEFGAGTGKLAADILNALGDACCEYRIVDVSATLRARQLETIKRLSPIHAHKVRWCDALPETLTGCVIGNEVLDAMPVKLVEKTAHGWVERGVGHDGKHFIWTTLGKIDGAEHGLPENLPTGYCTEIGLEARAFAATVASLLERGAALFIDYGFPAHEYYHPQRHQGTLMCHYRHRAHDNPLEHWGDQDITAHVNFTRVAEAAVDAGAEHAGYITQARFLLNLGITQLLSDLPEPQRLRETPAVQRLLSEAEMGDLFKVWGCTRGVDEPLIGFSQGDRSHTL